MGFLETSAKKSQNVNKAFMTVAQLLYEESITQSVIVQNQGKMVANFG